jgi:hypothetical protein
MASALAVRTLMSASKVAECVDTVSGDKGGFVFHDFLALKVN